MEEGGGGEGGGGARDTESKTRTPHKDVGNKLLRGKNLRLVSCSLVLVWNNLQRAKNLKTANYQRKMATPSQLFVTE